MAESDDILTEAKEAFRVAEEGSSWNRATALDDIRFARAGEQWPESIRRQRDRDGRPCLTINRLPAFIRQVVNDARQNKPAIKVHPADSGADPATADVINGLIRNIEYTSNADVAYDTGVECAVTGGFGYWRVALDYAHDDAFDLDILIRRIANPFSVYGDPHSTEADSSDWNTAFVVDRISKAQYEAQYNDKAKVDWDDSSWADAGDWLNDEGVLVAEWWRREEVDRRILSFTDINGRPFVTDENGLKDEDIALRIEQGLLTFVRERMGKGYKVTQTILSGAEVLRKPVDWPGRFIPIIPVYGDEFDIKGKRYFRSLVHNAVDAQQMFNFWRTASTELVALAPRVPFIGPKGFANPDQDRWNTVNTQSHAYLEYDGLTPPQRQPLDMGVAAGALQEAMNASDDMKAIIGLHDASLGARSNETSGRAILARQREGDVSTFHFTDNMTRAIRHTGRILIDLIPKVYNEERIVRIIGEDGSQEAKPINQEYPATDPETGQPMRDDQGNAILAMHDLSAGRYDLTVTTGPSFTTRREEAAMQMTEMIRAFPDAAPIVGPELAKNLDWPGADKIAEKMEAMSAGPQIPPEVQQQIEAGMQRIQELEQENTELKQSGEADMAKAQMEIASKERIAEMEIASDERIARMKEESAARVAAYKAELQAQSAAFAAANRPAQRPAA